MFVDMTATWSFRTLSFSHTQIMLSVIIKSIIVIEVIDFALNIGSISNRRVDKFCRQQQLSNRKKKEMNYAERIKITVTSKIDRGHLSLACAYAFEKQLSRIRKTGILRLLRLTYLFFLFGNNGIFLRKKNRQVIC